MTMNKLIMDAVLESRINFLFEKWNELYKRYSEVNIAKEKFIIDQEALRSSLLSKLAGKGGTQS